MTLLHPAILIGLGLAAIPVILHLLLRQKPKKLLFPALRLIQNRRKQNVRRMRIRHLLLLALRILVIGLFVFAIARPSVPAADYTPSLSETLTFLGIVGLCVAAYYVLSHRWKSSDLPTHAVQTMQSKLRSRLVVGAVLLTLLAVLWPYQRRVAADLKSPTPAGDLSLPVAGVFLFDTSLSMQFQQESKTRLDVAREIALDHLSDLPSGSRVAVSDVGNDHPILFQSTLAGAKTRMESLELRPVRIPLNDRIRAAVRLHEDDRKRTLAEQGAVAEDQRTDRYLRRVYVLTDLSRSAWRIGGTSRLADELERLKSVNVFLIDVGQPDPPNTAITDVEPLRPRVTTGGEAFIRATVTGVGRTNAEQSIELLLDEGNGRLVKADQKSIPLADDAPQVVEFGPLAMNGGPIVHGEVRLISSDPLPFDDSRFFTLQVRPPINILTIAPNADDAEEWNFALISQGYKPTTIRPAGLIHETLSDYEVVCMINIPSLKDEQWFQLGQFVQQGGGLGVFLGSRDTGYNSNYGRDEPQAFLPGKPEVHTAPGVKFMRVTNDQHAMMQAMAKEDLIGLLESIDIERFWRVELTEGANVVAEYNNDKHSPALLERMHGQGRVMMFTTAVNLKPFRQRWNYLPDPSGPIQTFLAFADEMVRHLAQDSDVQLTYDAGEQPVMRLPPADESRSFLLQQPEFRQTRLTLAEGESLLSVPDAQEIGSYSLKQNAEDGVTLSGFSVNPPSGESDFTRASPEELNNIIGKGRYQLAQSIGELQENINIADLGRELFPLVLAIVVLIFCAEHFMANWFYDDEPGSTPSRVSWEAKTPESAPSTVLEAT
ncbi:MAG: BatA domain-containing protein [Planctomycetaceae bacterium]|nr:BatA domain-containing protein [Planctomycetaceae bacterium]